MAGLTEDQLRRDKEVLEREIAERQAKLAYIAEKLKSLAHQPHQEARAVATNGHAEAPGRSGPSLTAAIERIVTTSPAPLSKKHLKEKLAADFSEDRLGPYFYTCLMRLKKNERIRVMGDGKVWKP